MAYRLRLPPEAKIHDIFYVSQFKRYDGKGMQVQCDLPSFWEVRAKKPNSILERRMIKQGNHVVTQVLIKWEGKDIMDATWKDFQLMKERFPGFNLAAEVDSWKGRMSGSNPGDLTMKG